MRANPKLIDIDKVKEIFSSMEKNRNTEQIREYAYRSFIDKGAPMWFKGDYAAFCWVESVLVYLQANGYDITKK